MAGGCRDGGEKGLVAYDHDLLQNLMVLVQDAQSLSSVYI